MMEKYEKIQNRNRKSFYDSIKEGIYSMGEGIYSIFNSFSESLEPRRFRGQGRIRLSVDRNNKKSIEEKLSNMRLDGLEDDARAIRGDWESVGNDFKKAFSYFNFKKK